MLQALVLRSKQRQRVADLPTVRNGQLHRRRGETMTKQRATQLRRLVVKDLYMQGMLPREMAEYIGCSIPTIYRDLYSLGLWKKRKGRKQKVFVVGSRFCSVCGRPAQEKFQKKWWCEIHLADAGADPDYYKKQRAAAGQRHASHGRDMK